MTKHYALQASLREQAGKGSARAIRREGNIPAVIYGDKKEPITITLPLKEVSKEYHKGHMFTTLCDITIDGKSHQVLARDVQTHPVTDFIEHVDFLRVTDKTSLTVSVPVNFNNYDESPAAEGKGVLNVVRYDVDVVCKAVNIPEGLDVDMSKAEIGDTFKISDVQMPEGAKPYIDDRDFTLCTIAAPKRIVDEEEEKAEGEEGAEGEAAEGEEGAAEGGEEKAEEAKAE